MRTPGQRQTYAEAQEAAAMTISLAKSEIAEILTSVIRNSAMTDEEIEDLSNRIGRIPHERARQSSDF